MSQRSKVKQSDTGDKTQEMRIDKRWECGSMNQRGGWGVDEVNLKGRRGVSEALTKAVLSAP